MAYAEFPPRKRVDEIAEGDVVDLQNDPFADPEGYAAESGRGDEGRIDFQFEYATVDAIELENGPDGRVVVLHTNQGSFGFPADHRIALPE